MSKHDHFYWSRDRICHEALSHTIWLNTHSAMLDVEECEHGRMPGYKGKCDCWPQEL